jgi:polyribonucleotide nucleotidyltransferase
MNEVQVVCTVMSADKETDPDIPAMIGTSAALAISGCPFNGPIGGARVGFTEASGYVLNPTYSALADSQLDMVVAGTKDAVLMVESQAKELTEDQMLGAVLFAHQEMQTVINAINELVAEAGKPRWEWQAPEADEELVAAVQAAASGPLGEAYRITEKAARYERVGQVKDDVVAQLATDDGPAPDDVKDIFKTLEKNIVRSRILAGEPRIDGRDNRTVRAIACELMYCRRHTVLHSSPVAKLRPLVQLRWGLPGTRRSLTLWKVNAATHLCFIIIFHPTLWEKRGASVLLAVVKWVMGDWQDVVWQQYCQVRKNFLTPYALFPRLLSPTALVPWHQFVSARSQ